ncbi:hypothetical protein T08_9525 [Trichinella sp. T8]|nr:hypothetical protein T08_9525 [Trichinella sp. T8]
MLLFVTDGRNESISFGQLYSSVSQVGPFHHNESDRSRFIVEPRLSMSAGFELVGQCLH